MPKTSENLSAKEAIFVNEFLIDKNASRAARAAGYAERSSAKTGWEMLQKPRIQDAIKAAMDEQSKRTLIAADQILKDIERIAAKAEGEGEYNAALKGKELLGKHYKLFTEKHEHGGIGGGSIVMQVTTTDEKL